MANIIYGFTALTGGAADALDAIDGGILVANDVAVGVVSGIFRSYYLSASSGAAESSPNIIAPDTNAGTKRWILVGSNEMPKNHITGLGMSHAADTDHDITVAAGEARDATDADDMVLASEITKQADATWAVGTAAGGMTTGENLVTELMTLDVAPGGAGWAVGDTITGNTSAKTCVIIQKLSTTTYYVKNRSGAFTLGEIMTNGTATADQGAGNPTFAAVVGTIHVWLIKRSDTGVVDVMFNNDWDTGLSPALPTNYDYKRRIGSYRTDASANILNGDYWGTGNLRTFMFDSPQRDLAAAPGDTNAHLLSLSVPGGIKIRTVINSTAAGTSTTYFSCPDNTDMAASTTEAPLGSASAFAGQGTVFTNTSSQIRYRMSSSQTLYIVTLGWEDSL